MKITEINEIENKMNRENKGCFLKKINKIDKILVRLTKKKKTHYKYQ